MEQGHNIRQGLYSSCKLGYRLEDHFTVMNKDSAMHYFIFPYFIFLFIRNWKLKAQLVDMTDVRAAGLVRTTGV